MSEKRFIRNIMGNIYDSKTDKWFEEDWKGKPLDYDDDLIVFLNEQQATIQSLKDENEQLRTQLLICQQSKNDDGRFQVWEVPPIPKGTRITFSTTERSGKNE